MARKVISKFEIDEPKSKCTLDFNLTSRQLSKYFEEKRKAWNFEGNGKNPSISRWILRNGRLTLVTRRSTSRRSFAATSFAQSVTQKAGWIARAEPVPAHFSVDLYAPVAPPRCRCTDGSNLQEVFVWAQRVESRRRGTIIGPPPAFCQLS